MFAAGCPPHRIATITVNSVPLPVIKEDPVIKKPVRRLF
jgi:hypothetical protein